MLDRRSFLRGLGAALVVPVVAVPSIVHAENLMRVIVPRKPRLIVVTEPHVWWQGESDFRGPEDGQLAVGWTQRELVIREWLRATEGKAWMQYAGKDMN